MRLSKTSILKLNHYAEPLSYIDLYIEVVADHIGYVISRYSKLDSVPFNRAQYILVRNTSTDRIYHCFKNVNQFLQYFCYLRNSLIF